LYKSRRAYLPDSTAHVLAEVSVPFPMRLHFLSLLLALPLFAAARPEARWNDQNAFVTIKDKNFFVNGSTFFFYGSVSYWLNMLDDNELDAAFANIAGAGIHVVRTRAFNDVSQKPAAGTYFQILEGGNATINEGPDGLQRLDKVVATAERYGIRLILTLTNNWNPERPQPPTAVGRRDNNAPLPRGFLSNDYGGMDLYVRNFHPGGTHDLFYTDSTIVQAFKNYTSLIVRRYANSSAIFAWELANDPRCSSTLPASSTCNTHTITEWAADLSGFVKSLDPNHLVTAGDGGFYCINCPKLFANKKAKRDFSPVGPSFDGSFGVDTEDIISIPTIDFGSFQYFPDQVSYFQDTPANRTIANIASGDHWVIRHSDTATQFGKPEVMTAFGLVLQSDLNTFVPFNETAPTPGGPPGVLGITVPERDFSIASFVTTSYNGNIGGLIEFDTTPPNARIVKRSTNYPTPAALGAALMASKH